MKHESFHPSVEVLGFAGPARGFVSSEPATNWEHALVTGNGRIGALVYGRPLDETVVLNHARLYMPLPQSLPPPDTASRLGEIRRAISDGSYQRAADIVVEQSLKEGYSGMQWTDPYVPAFDVCIQMKGASAVRDYSRSVDFATGVAAVRWADETGTFERRLFVSRADDAFVLSIGSGVPGSINCDISLATHLPAESESSKEREAFANGIAATAVGAEEGWLTFRAGFKHKRPGSLQGYEGVVRVIISGGTATVVGDRISVSGADGVLLLGRISMLQDYLRSEIPLHKSALAELDPNFGRLLARHEKIHGSIFNRMRLCLDGGSNRNQTSEELIANAGTNELSPALLEKEFDAGRYNILCSSGEMFPNLQGIWSGTYTPMWSGDFTLNGNVQCAIASDLAGNMAECLLPFFTYLEDRMADFRTNASRLYGCRGIMVPARTSINGLGNHFNEKWPHTFWVSGSAWAAQSYYDYYLYSGDKDFLCDHALPFMKEAALFYEDFVVDGPDGRWQFTPSHSPENHPGNSSSQACINATMDISAAKELLGNCIAACSELDCDPDLVNRWRAMLAKMPDYQIGADGALKEWTTPLLDNNDAHRHCSHLYAIYYGLPAEISANPALCRAFETALEKRLDVRQAEFCEGNDAQHRGEMAFGIVQAGFAAASLRNGRDCGEMINWLSGNYWRSNMVTTHDPRSIFNTDLSGGLPALLIRMLVDSQPGWIELLPALPPDWPSGKIEGVRCRGQIEVRSLAWTESGVTVTLTSEKPQKIQLGVYGAKSETVELSEIQPVTFQFPR